MKETSVRFLTRPDQVLPSIVNHGFLFCMCLFDISHLFVTAQTNFGLADEQKYERLV